ncbi:hypothetical protein ID854_03360 [Xenorhabdus sp. M]|uniref:Uncharacterized protein n=1 Tax=Xenorhabdus szentirmaii TaxID=290112 RepID=A0AAW3YNC9_9GAMM|nr:hypothetical protein [Xenorhabdus sp. M]MBD2799522.1 hypothetical protein [Xenorhabdus sp. M]
MNNEYNEEPSLAAYINNTSPKYTAEIELTHFLQGKNYDDEDIAIAYGKVFNDSRKKFKDGVEIMTSLVTNADTYQTDGYIKTQNSIYKIRKVSTLFYAVCTEVGVCNFKNDRYQTLKAIFYTKYEAEFMVNEHKDTPLVVVPVYIEDARE